MIRSVYNLQLQSLFLSYSVTRRMSSTSASYLHGRCLLPHVFMHLFPSCASCSSGYPVELQQKKVFRSGNDNSLVVYPYCELYTSTSRDLSALVAPEHIKCSSSFPLLLIPQSLLRNFGLSRPQTSSRCFAPHLDSDEYRM